MLVRHNEFYNAKIPWIGGTLQVVVSLCAFDFLPRWLKCPHASVTLTTSELHNSDAQDFCFRTRVLLHLLPSQASQTMVLDQNLPLKLSNIS